MKNLFVQGYPGYPHSQEADCPPHLAHEKKEQLGHLWLRVPGLQSNVLD